MLLKNIRPVLFFVVELHFQPLLRPLLLSPHWDRKKHPFLCQELIELPDCCFDCFRRYERKEGLNVGFLTLEWVGLWVSVDIAHFVRLIGFA